MTVRYLRSLDRTGSRLPACQQCARQLTHIGPPPSTVQVFNVIHAYLGRSHPDPDGEHLHDLCQILEQAACSDADLVVIDWCATPQLLGEGGIDERTATEIGRTRAFHAERHLLVTYSPVRTIVLHRLPPGSTGRRLHAYAPPATASHTGRGVYNSSYMWHIVGTQWALHMAHVKSLPHVIHHAQCGPAGMHEWARRHAQCAIVPRAHKCALCLHSVTC